MLAELYNNIRDDAHAQVLHIDGHEYVTNSVTRVKKPMPDTLSLSTLGGLVDYIKANPDKLPLDKLVCTIDSPKCITLRSVLDEATVERGAYLLIEPLLPDMHFGEKMDAEAFNIWLQSSFVPNEDREKVLAYSSNVSSVAEMGVEDDGVRQAVSVRSGVASKGLAVLPNPVVLQPYRTFVEVEQPQSAFIFRAHQHGDNGVRFSLTAADGGAWRPAAIRAVKAYLAEHTPELRVLA